jgi:hypothetical protein
MARPKKDKQPARLTVTLDESDYQKVCTLADQNDVSAAWVIRRAVHDFLERGGGSMLQPDDGHIEQRRA